MSKQYREISRRNKGISHEVKNKETQVMRINISEKSDDHTKNKEKIQKLYTFVNCELY